MTLVTIITSTTGHPALSKALASVRALLDGHKGDVIELPYATGLDRYNGHRIYGAAGFLARGDLICWLDKDNFLEPDHVTSLVKVIKAGRDWAFSLRRIVDLDGNYLCDDDCESLGKWPSILAPDDYFVDVNCFMLVKPLAIKVSPIWHARAREPRQMEVDRVLTKVLRQSAPKFDGTWRHTANYRVGNTELSVRAEFFTEGNARMKARLNGRLPWRR